MLRELGELALLLLEITLLMALAVAGIAAAMFLLTGFLAGPLWLLLWGMS